MQMPYPTGAGNDEASYVSPPLGIVTRVVRCPKEATPDGLLIATWRADQFRKPLAKYLERARRLMQSAPGRFAPAQIGLSDHDRRTFARLGCADDIEACLIAAWMAVGVEEHDGRVSARSSWDYKLFAPRFPEMPAL